MTKELSGPYAVDAQREGVGFSFCDHLCELCTLSFCSWALNAVGMTKKRALPQADWLQGLVETRSRIFCTGADLTEQGSFQQGSGAS